MRTFVIALVAFALSGCESVGPATAGYTGPTAFLEDSIKMAVGASCGEFYILHQYNGKDMDNAITASARASNGQGFRMTAQGAERPIPAQEAAFHLVGRIHCAAPIQELTRTIYEGAVAGSTGGTGVGQEAALRAPDPDRRDG
jgi:hypothetical protein